MHVSKKESTCLVAKGNVYTSNKVESASHISHLFYVAQVNQNMVAFHFKFAVGKGVSE